MGGATRYIFVTSPGADRIQWGGGGVVADIFRYLNYRIGFSGGGGGGVVAEIFPGNKSITFPRFRRIFCTFSGHLGIIRRLWTLAEIHGHFPCLLTHSNHLTTSIHSGKKQSPKVWGGHGPPGPPLATPLGQHIIYTHTQSEKTSVGILLAACASAPEHRKHGRPTSKHFFFSLKYDVIGATFRGTEHRGLSVKLTIRSTPQVEIYAFGIEKAYRPELQSIASNLLGHVFLIPSFHLFGQLARSLHGGKGLSRENTSRR